MPVSKQIFTFHAPTIWKCLNGELNVFKPAGMAVNLLKASIRTNISKDLNSLEVRPTRSMVSIDPNPANPNEYAVNVVDNLSDHVLAIGPRYDFKDIKCVAANHLGRNTSGVLILSFNENVRNAFKIREAASIRTYHVTGRFGMSTENNFKDSLMTSKATYSHIYPDKLAQFLASMQASHQKKMFELCGVDLRSQTAFEIASRGLIRPAKKDVPVVYGIRCIEFKRPEFVLEIQAINENEEYLCTIIAEVGIQMHTVAHCRAIRCVRYGPFHVEQSLLRGNWKLQDAINNMQQCAEIIRKNPNVLDPDTSNGLLEENPRYSN